MLDIPVDLFSEHKIFAIIARIPCKAVPLVAAGSYHLLGFPKFHRLAHISKAVQIRFALRTCSVWKELYGILQAEASQNLGINMLVDGRWTPGWWTDEPMVQLLKRASDFFPELEVRSNLRKLKRDWLHGNIPHDISIQRLADDAITKDNELKSWPDLIFDRIGRFAPGAVANVEAIKHALGYLARLPAPIRSDVIRTWLHGWFTTKRMHEAVRQHCYACGAGDADQRHYFNCDLWWRPFKNWPGFGGLLQHRLGFSAGGFAVDLTAIFYLLSTAHDIFHEQKKLWQHGYDDATLLRAADNLISRKLHELPAPRHDLPARVARDRREGFCGIGRPREAVTATSLVLAHGSPPLHSISSVSQFSPDVSAPRDHQ